MINTIATNQINYVDANGHIVFNVAVQTIQVRSAADLALLTGFGPGTRAYLADESKMWEYGADAQWHIKVGMPDEGDATVVVAQFITDDGVTTCNKTAEQLAAAVEAGKTVLGIYENTLGAFDAENIAFYFVAIDTTDVELDNISIMWDDSNDEWDVTTTSYTLTPAE